MNTNHLQIDKLKQNFKNIMNLSTDISKVKLKVNNKLDEIKKLYNNVVKCNNKKIFLFCLDSFHFQYKNFKVEAENIDRMRLLINNRMYCDYYKLYNIMIKFMKEQKSNLVLHDIDNSYPIYKDLEPFLEYKTHDIKSIHNNILELVHILYNEIDTNSENITHYNDNNQMGFSISNFLNTLDYENKLLREQIELYVNYLCFFHISQKKQLKSIYSKILEFDKDITDNVNINKTYSIDDINVEEFFTEEEETNAISILEQDQDMMDNILIINPDEIPVSDEIPVTIIESKKEEPKPTKEEPKRKKTTMIM